MNKVELDYDIKLPETELDVMIAVWDMAPPVTSSKLMKVLGNDRGWKAPTLISFLNRLEDKGFISSSKNGKERVYTPLAEREEYMQRTTSRFVREYHGGSVASFLSSLHRGKKLNNDDIEALLAWLKEKYH